MFPLFHCLVSHWTWSLSITLSNLSHQSDFLGSLEFTSEVLGPVSHFDILGGSRNLLLLFD